MIFLNLIIIYFLFVLSSSMVRLYKQISIGLEVLQYFTTRKWIFHNNKILAMFNELSPEDKKMFRTFMTADTDKMEYFKNMVLGARQYCMKEDLSSLPRARRHQKM